MKFSDMNTGLPKRMFNNMTSPTIGGDPEFFITDKEGKVTNADMFLPGKRNPIPVSDYRGKKESSRVFFDGIQGEMAPKEQQCREYFAHNIQRCFRAVYNRIPEDHSISLAPSARVTKRVLNRADPEARMFGCEPDFNAYTGNTNTPEMDASNHPFRYAGGHMHLGASSKYIQKDSPEYQLINEPESHLRAIKLLDLMVTIPTILLDKGPGSQRRRSKYGKAGCFRPTPYGVEYRTPSCWWLGSPMAVSLIYGLARVTWSVLVKNLNEQYTEASGFDEETIRGAIDESDTKTIRKIWENIRPYVATTGHPVANPLHLGSLKTSSCHYVNSQYKAWEGLPPQITGKPVHSLAAFEYMLKHGVHSIIDKDVKKEWLIAPSPTGKDFNSTNGFVNESYKRLVRNKDFHKFQTSFMKKICPNN